MILRLGACEVCRRPSMTRHSGARWACAWCFSRIVQKAKGDK